MRHNGSGFVLWAGRGEEGMQGFKFLCSALVIYLGQDIFFPILSSVYKCKCKLTLELMRDYNAAVFALNSIWNSINRSICQLWSAPSGYWSVSQNGTCPVLGALTICTCLARKNVPKTSKVVIERVTWSVKFSVFVNREPYAHSLKQIVLSGSLLVYLCEYTFSLLCGSYRRIFFDMTSYDFLVSIHYISYKSLTNVRKPYHPVTTSASEIRRILNEICPF